ncbi:uncharacterized protein LOC126800294 isoform X2 [Argentina anserina]|uniref:uncharacterized protein LOC126800294 isoform X2 n=1 Tax=Argentina anserina TaxID=57926 RepID=UPI0021763986|nr:uncharacterized protein LOC126800294 isoform X2 [Potentilla anserina]
MATEADVPEAISIAKEEGVDRSLAIEQLDRTVAQCSPAELNKSKGDLDHHPDVQLEKPFANGENVQVEYSMEVESKSNSFGVSEGEHFLDPPSKISHGEQSNQAGMETPKSEVQLQKGTQVGGPVEETGSEDNEVIEERKEKFTEEENHDISIGAGIISEIKKTADANLEVEEVEASINETGVDQVISNQQDSMNEDVQCLEKEAEISSIDIKGADMADGNDDSYQKEASDLQEATTVQEYEASISTHDVANSSLKKDIELDTNVTSNDEEDSQKTLQNYEQKEELKKLPEVMLEDVRTESNEAAEVITCTEEEKAIQNAPEYAENEEANPVHCPKENDTVNEEVCEATSSEQEIAEHALLEIHAAENHPQEFSEEKSRDYQPSVEAAHLSRDTVEENLEEQTIQEKSPSSVEEETTQQISREEVHSSPLEEEKEADAECEDPIEVADTTREIEVETTEQRSETNKDIYVPIPKEEAYTDESTRTFVENNPFPSEVSEVKTKEIIQDDQPIVSDYGLVSGEVSQVSALEEAEAENKEHANNTPEEKGLQTIFTDETVVETEDYAEAGANFYSDTTEKEIQAAEDEGDTKLKEIDEDKEPVADANIAPDEGLATIIPDQPALHAEDIELQSEENVNSKDKLKEQIPTAADEGENGSIEAQTESCKQVTDTDIAAEEKDPETTLTNEKTLDVKDLDVQAEKAFSSEENLEKQLPVVADEGKRCLKEAEEEKEQEALTTIIKGEPPLDIELTDDAPEEKDPETTLTNEKTLDVQDLDIQAEESFSPNEKFKELISEGADECHTGLKEAEEENEQVKITDDAPEEKVAILTDERALGNDEIELQVEENASSIDNLDEQIQVTAEEGGAGFKEPDEDTIDSSPEKKALVTILTDETTKVAEDTDVKAGGYINSNEIEGESCSTEPQEVNKEKVTYTDITPEEKIVNSKEKLEEQVPVVADEGDTGVNETEEGNKEQTKSEDTTPEEKGLPIISTDNTSLASEEIESQSEGFVSSTDSLEKQNPTAADEAEYGLTEVEKQTTEQSTITYITNPEVKSVPMILTDQTALDSETIELHEEENVKSMDYSEKQIPLAANVGEDIFTEAEAESNEQVAITDITPEEKGVATILTDERSLETEHTDLQSVECANSIENLEEEILAAPELGETCLKQEDEVVNEEQVESSDSSHEAKVLATILTEETSRDIECADVQAGENFNSEDILEKQIPTAVHEGETDLKDVEEDNKEQVETTEIPPEENARGTILSDETAEGVELTNAQVEEINLKEVLEEQIPTASNAGEIDLKEAEADINEQVETTDIIPEQKSVNTILSDERDLKLEDVHVQEQENFSLNENPTVDEGVTDLKKGEAETKEQVNSTYTAPEEKDVTTILRDEMAAEIQDDDVQAEEKFEASEGEEKVGILDDIPVVDHNTELVEEATVEQSYQVPSHEEAEPKIAVEDEKSEEHPERNHVIVEEVLDEPTITSRDYSEEQIIEPNVASYIPEIIEEDTIKSSTETLELKEEGSCIENTKEENASDLTREYTLEDASEQIEDKDYNAVKSGNENLEDLKAAEVDESTTCETKNVEPAEEIFITSYDVQQGEGSSPAPTEKLNEEGSSIGYVVEDKANDISTEYVAEDIDDKLKECIEESKGQIIEGNIATSKPESIEEETVKNSQDIEKVTEELKEEGSSTESIKEENASELSPEYKEDAFDSAEKKLKDSQISGDDESSICETVNVEGFEETPSTLPVVQLLLQKQVQENIDEGTISVQETKDDDNGVVTVTETITEVSSNDEDGSPQVLQKSEQEEEVTAEQGEGSSRASSEALNKENINEVTMSVEVVKDDGNYGAVNITETSAKVPSNDKEAPEVLQNYEPVEVIKKLPDLEHEETTQESSSENAKEEIQESLDKEKVTKESETSSGEVLGTTITEALREIHPVEDTTETATEYQACTEGAELSAEGEKENSEDQTTQEVSPSLIVETTEESSKEEEKSEGHFECQDSIEEAKSETLEDTTEPKPISDEESNKTLVEDNSNSLEASEKEVEKEIKREYSSTVRSLDSEVVSDNQTSFTEATAEDNEQVETTQIAPEQKDNEGTDAYKTELVGETIVEPSFQVQTLEEAATLKLDVEDETDKSVDLPEKNNKICEEVLAEPKITDRDFNVEQATEGNVSNLRTETIEEYDAIKDYKSEEKEKEKLNEEGSCIETINEGNANDISTESAPEDKDEKLTECIEEAFEEQITDRNLKTFSPESIEDDTVQNSQDNETEIIEIKEDGRCSESIKGENVSVLKEEYKEDGSKSEEEILEDSKSVGVDESTTCVTVNVETSEETPSTLPVVQSLLQNQVQENIDEDTFSVQQTKDGDDGTITITETSAEVPSNDENDSPQLLQKYEPEEELTNLRDVLPEETKIESSSEIAEVITYTKEETKEENDTSTGEVLETTITEALREIPPVEDTAETAIEYQACIEGAESGAEGEKENSEDQTTQGVSPSLILETSEESTKEEEKSEGHFECQDLIEEAKSEILEDTAEPKPISEEESNKTVVEDNSNSFEASEKEVEKENKGEYSFQVRSLDSEVVSDNQTSFTEATAENNEQVETTQIAPEQMDNEGIDVYKTELVRETIGEPSFQVLTLEEAATSKLDVEAETDKSVDLPEKNNKVCEEVLEEPRITDRDFNVEQTTEENVSNLTTEAIEEYDAIKDYQGEENETEKMNEEGSCIETINEGNANDISTDSAPEDKDEKLIESIEEAFEEQITDRNVKTFSPESIEDDIVQNSQDNEKEIIEVKEDGSCTESIKEENVSELKEEYKEDGSKSEEILEDSKSVGVDESTTCATVNVETSEEIPGTLPVVQSLLQNQVQDKIDEDTFSVQQTKDGDDGAVTVTETSAEVPSNDENDSPQLLQKYEPEEELTNLRDVLPEETKIESSSEIVEVTTCTKEETQEENATSTGEVLETTFTEALQEIHPIEDTAETAREYQACIEGAELSAEGEKENSEDQTTQEVSPSLILETSEDNSKEEEKSEGHFECQDSIEEAKSETLEDTTEPKPISEEESNKTLVEDNSNSLKASEKEVEKVIKVEYSSTVRSLDSEVINDNQTSFTEATAEDNEQVETTQISPEQKDNETSFSDNQTSFTEATAKDNEQVETTQISPEQKDNEGTDVYKTELVRETIEEPSFQVQTLEEARTPKLDVEDETDKSDDPLEKNNKSCEEVLEEPKITDKDFNVEQTTEGIVANLTTEAIKEQEMVKDYQGEKEEEAEKLNEGSCIETINEGNANDISTDSAPEVKDETFKECIEEAVEEQVTESKMKTFTPKSSKDDTVRNSQESEKETIEVKEENVSELSEVYKEDASKSEEEILEDSKTVGVDDSITCETVNVETSEETPNTLPVVQLLLHNQVQENKDEDTFSVQETKDGDDGAVTITETSAEVPSNDENDSPQLLQKYESEEELTNLRDVLPEETKIESSSENAEVVTCTKMETQEESDTSPREASMEVAALSNEVEKEQQTTGEETTEESSKEEDKEEGHEECKETSEVAVEEMSNKTLVEDGPNSSDASEEVIEKEMQGEYSSTSRSIDSEVVSDKRGLMEAPEQVEATHSAPEEKDIGGTDDVYNTELVGQTIEPSSQVQTVEEVKPKLEVEDENDKADDHPEKSDNTCEKVLDEPEITERNFHEEQITEVHELEDKVSVAERKNEETKEVEVSNMALEKLDSDAPEETIECSEVVIESDSKCIDVVAEGEAIAAQTRDEEISKEPSTLLCEERELRASEHEHTKEVEVPTEEDSGDLLVAKSAEEICLPKEEPRELNVSELALEKLDAGQTEEETKETTETVSKADSQSIALVTEDETITDQTQCEGEKELEASEVVQEALNADAPEEETKDGSAMVPECNSEITDEPVKEELQIPSTTLHPEEKELVASKHEHETTNVEKSTEDEIPKEVDVPDENKQDFFAATPTKTCLQTEEPRDTESALYKPDVGETEEEIEGTYGKVTRFDSQSVVMASRDEIIVDQILCEGITHAPVSKERELGASELALEKMAAVDTEEIREGQEIVPNFDSGIIEVVLNDEIISDQTFDEEMLKEQIQSPSSTLLPEEKEHEAFEPKPETIAQEKSTEQECKKEVEVSVGESSQALLAQRPVEAECSQKEEPSELNVSELSLGKIDAADTEEANTTFEMVSTPGCPSIVAGLEEITVDETLSKGVTDIPPEIPSYTSFHEEKEPKASELYHEKLDADIPEEEIECSEVIPQSVSQSSCEVLKVETVADQLEIPSSALLPDEKELKDPEHKHGTVVNEKNLGDENLKEVKAPTDEASEYVFVARSVDETCLQKEEPSKLEVPESALEKLGANGAEEVKTETVSKFDSQSINAVPKDDFIANQTLSDVITDMPLDIPSYTSLPKENEEAKKDATELTLEKLEADEPAEVKKGYEVTPKSDLQSFDVVAREEIITDQVLQEGIAKDELQEGTLLPEEKELKETEHEHGTAPQDNLEDECAKETEVTADRDLRDVSVPSSEEKTNLHKEEAGELKDSELSPESEGEKEITATFESTDAVPKEETTAEQTLHQQEEQLQIASPTLLPKERDEETVHREELEDCKVLELSLKGETEEETKEASETSPQVSLERIDELATDEIVDQIPPSLISEEKSCENITTINNAGEEGMNVVRSPNDESRKDTISAEEISIPNEEPRELNVSDLEFPSSQYRKRESSNEGKNLEVATFDSGADNSCETTVEANQIVKNEVQNEEIKDEKEVGKDSQLISVGEEYMRESQQENESREEEYPKETIDTFTAPNEYHHEVAEVDRTGRLSEDIEKQVILDDKSSKNHNPDEAERRIQETVIHAGLENQGDEINSGTNPVEVTYPGQKGSSVEISQGVMGVGEANGTTQDTKQLEKESHATNIPSSKDDAQNFPQDLKSEDTKPSNDTLVVRDIKDEKFCGSATETVDSTSAQCSLSERLMEESEKERVVTHLPEGKEPTVGKELQAHEEEEDEHENVEEAKTDEEKEDFEHKRASQGYDEPVIVEASRDSEVKVSSKKSHNILSGMGKSVKHSISKVKKAIIGKSSNSKTQSEK